MAFQLTRSFKAFFESERAGGLVLLACTIISMFVANSSWGESYLHFWHAKLDLSFSFVELNYSVEEWVNDGLMAIFFLLVGLEIERELYAGELKEIRNAILPIVAALGGMVVPAAIHYYFNAGTNTQHGFGIPMATDIAFALGMLSLLGNRVPASLKIFLTALAIIDDLGAILVIAIFYNTGISWLYLGLALGIFALLLVLNRLKVHKLVFYLIPGVIMWYCMLKSGVHATITGVLLAFAIPFNAADAQEKPGPSFQLQHWLHKPVAFLILPFFALANTGLPLANDWMAQLKTNNSIGIMAGLLVGKTVGILFFCWILVKSRLGRLPEGVSWNQLLGTSTLAGIGFTMSIFITNLAFTDADTIQYSKVAVLSGSLLSCIAGLLILYFSRSKTVDLK